LSNQLRCKKILMIYLFKLMDGKYYWKAWTNLFATNFHNALVFIKDAEENIWT
jgi:hypothetical protein